MSKTELAVALEAKGIRGSYAARAKVFMVHETTLMRWLKGELPIPAWVPKFLAVTRKRRGNSKGE